MPQLALSILYVDSPAESAKFYADLFETSPEESSPTFAMFKLTPEVGVGLWSRHTVEPAAAAAGGGTELAFIAEDVDTVHASWLAKGLTIIQEPVELDFGRTFVALDPDGHRLRVFAPNGS